MLILLFRAGIEESVGFRFSDTFVTLYLVGGRQTREWTLESVYIAVKGENFAFRELAIMSKVHSIYSFPTFYFIFVPMRVSFLVAPLSRARGFVPLKSKD